MLLLAQHLLPMLFRFLVKDATVKNTSDILLPQDSIFRPDEQISSEPYPPHRQPPTSPQSTHPSPQRGAKLTLKERSPPPKEIQHKRLSPPRREQLLDRQTALMVPIVLGEEILKVLRPKAALVVVAHAVAAVLGPVHALRVDAEEGVRQDAGDGRVAEEAVDEEHGVQAERHRPAPGAEAGVRVARPDDAVVVAVEVVGVLDHDLETGGEDGSDWGFGIDSMMIKGSIQREM